MARSIFELVFRAVDQGASATVNGLQSALGGMPGAAQHAGAAMQQAMSQTGAAASQAAHAAQAGATSALHSVQQAATQTGAAVQHTAQAAGQAAESMGARFAKVAAAIGAMGFIKASVSEFATFESAMLKVQALSGAVGADFDALNAKAKELGANTKYTAAEAAAGMSQLAASGYNTTQILDAIGPAMYAAAAGGSDLAETADQLTNIMGAFGLEADQAGRVADVLTQGFTGAATTMSELAYAMKPAGAIAKALGYSLEETVAILQTLANVGFKGEQAGTALRGALSRLLNPTKEVTEVLEKYNIQINDADGKIRKFSAIIGELGRAGAEAGDMLKLFGQEAGPAMQAILGQGAQAIDDYEQSLLKAGGRAKEVADHMESGIEGALNRLSAAWSEVKNGFGKEFAPTVIAIADALAKLAGWFTQLPEWVRQIIAWGLAFAALGATLPAVIAVLKMLFGLFGPGVQSLVAFRAGVGTASAAIQGLAGACLAGKVALGGLVVAAGLGLVKIVEFAKVLWDCKRASDEVAASQKRGEELRARQAEQLARISKATGVTIKSFQELMQAQKEGKIHYDAATKSWVAGAKQRAEASEETAKTVVKAEGEALKALIGEYKKHFDEIIRLQEEVTGRQKSLAAELRDMGRTGMSDKDAWADQKREAEEYVAAAKRAAEEAKRAMASGDTITGAARWKEAVQYADDAKSAYRSLNKEVKDGDQVIVSKADALKTAMDGVKEAGELAVDLLKQQQQEAYKTMDALEKQSGFAGLMSHMDEALNKWMEGWRAMQGVGEETVENVTFRITEQERQIEGLQSAWMRSWQNNRNYFVKVTDELQRKLDEATKPRTVKVYVAEVQKRRWGGLIGDAMQLARGGKLPGYGGGDRVSALLEAGEFVVRKEAVKRFGAGFFEALNHLRVPDLSTLMPQMPQPALATPMGHMVLELKLPGGDSVTATVSKEDAETLARHNRRVSNLRFRK